MALCTKCGRIINNADVYLHTCPAGEIPNTGFEKVLTTTNAER